MKQNILMVKKSPKGKNKKAPIKELFLNYKKFSNFLIDKLSN